MVACLEKAKELMGSILTISIEVVSWSKNANVDPLAKLASTKDAELHNAVSVEFLARGNGAGMGALMVGSHNHVFEKR